ncbi:MAG: GTP cyclohydrolase II, partial [Alphaproteobacteria bacterium]|nr:GTP cyclohydrolase II [Alphaproteobacteria bacterium]
MEQFKHNLLIQHLSAGIPFIIGKGERDANDMSNLYGMVMARHYQSADAIKARFAENIYRITQKHGESGLAIYDDNDAPVASNQFSDELQQAWQYLFHYLHPLPYENTLIFADSASVNSQNLSSLAYFDMAQCDVSQCDVSQRGATHQQVSQPYKIAETLIPLQKGQATLMLYQGEAGFPPTAMLAIGDITENAITENNAPMLVRLHSECFTGDVLGSRKCDCGYQLQHALDRIFEAGRGIILYLPQEGRGIGLPAKLHAYRLQDQQGLDTIEANQALGLAVDNRDFSFAIKILQQHNINALRLISNNPYKKQVLEQAKIKVVEMVAMQANINEDN